MQTMKLRAIQLPGNAGELLDSFIRSEGHLADDSRELKRERGMPVMEVRHYDENGNVEESGTWVRVQPDQWQRCNE